MRTKNFLQHLILGALLLTTGKVIGQTSVVGNVAGITTDFLGWNNTMPNNNFPLMVRHDLNQPIEWYTDSIRRMWLTPTLQNQNFAWWQTGNLDFSGHLKIGIPTNDPPLTYLHINRSPQGWVSVGYRPWMRTGTFMSEATDAMYVGLWTQGASANAVINWSDDRAQIDPLRFIFTSTPDSLDPTETTNRYRGLEIARMIPDNDGAQGYLGVGDYATAGLQPTERVDLVDGRLRIRDLPDDPETQDEYLVMVVDNTADPNERGVVKWKDLGNMASGCEWTMAPNPGPNHISTAYSGLDPNCPDVLDAVGIGMDLAGTTPSAKLNLYTRDFQRGVDVLAAMATQSCTGVKVYATNGTFENRGLDVDAVNTGPAINDNFGGNFKVTGPTLYSKGVYAHTDGATGAGSDSRGGEFHSWDDANYTHGAFGQVRLGRYGTHGVRGVNHAYGRHNYGVLGEATGTSHPNTTYYGVKGEAFAGYSDLPVSVQAYGVYGEAPSIQNAVNATSWAVFARGDLKVTGDAWGPNLWNTSDAQFKTNVEGLVNANDWLMVMSPKSYNFVTHEHPHLKFAQEVQYGLIAQELEAILPSLVKSTFVPAVYDTVGTLIHEGLSHKGVNYIGLIPILIAGHQEQQAVIEQQEAQIAAQDSINQVMLDRLDALEQLLAACCQNPGGSDQRNLLDDGPEIFDQNSGDRNLRIQPNPFNEQTTVYYNLERSGRMQLMANSSDGKQLRVLHEAQMEQGEYQYEWQTADLAPGIYYVTLLLDGEPIVKKAVKVR